MFDNFQLTYAHLFNPIILEFCIVVNLAAALVTLFQAHCYHDCCRCSIQMRIAFVRQPLQSPQLGQLSHLQYNKRIQYVTEVFYSLQCTCCTTSISFREFQKISLPLPHVFTGAVYFATIQPGQMLLKVSTQAVGHVTVTCTCGYLSVATSYIIIDDRSSIILVSIECSYFDVIQYT